MLQCGLFKTWERPRFRQVPSSRLIACGLSACELPARRRGLERDWLQLQDGQPVLTQLTKALTRRRLQGAAISELHLIAHGNRQGFELAGQWINSATVLRHANELRQWDIGTLVLWCCDIGQNQEFISLLEDLTGAEAFSTSGLLNKHAINVSSQNGNTRQFLEIFQSRAIESWQGNLTWIQVGDEIEGRKKQARSGFTVSLSSDGSIVAIGSWNDRTIGSSRGSVAVYQLVNNS